LAEATKPLSKRLEANSVPCPLAIIDIYIFVYFIEGGNTRSSLDSRDGHSPPTYAQQRQIIIGLSSVLVCCRNACSDFKNLLTCYPGYYLLALTLVGILTCASANRMRAHFYSYTDFGVIWEIRWVCIFMGSHFHFQGPRTKEITPNA